MQRRPPTPRLPKKPPLPKPCATRLTAAINAERCVSNIKEAIALLQSDADVAGGHEPGSLGTIRQRVVGLLEEAVAPPPVPTPAHCPFGTVGGRLTGSFQPVTAPPLSDI
jgi:hypothetical protein